MSFPRYERYKASGVEWLGEVPEHWVPHMLHHVAVVNPTKSELGGIDQQTAVSFVPMEAMNSSGVPSLEIQRTVGDVTTGYTYFRDGDVAFAKVTPCFENGKRALFSNLENGIGFGTTELIVLRAKVDRSIPRYLYWLVATSAFLQLGEGAMYGAGGLKRVPESFVAQYAICVPPVEERVLVATFLDDETAKIDALIEEQRRLIELLKEKRQAVISHVITRGLSLWISMKDSRIWNDVLMPSHWNALSLKRISSKIVVGIVVDPSTYTVDNGHPFIFGGDIREGVIDHANSRRISEEDSRKNSKTKLGAGDLLTVRVGAPGVTAVVPKECEGGNCASVMLTRKGSFNSEWLCFAFNSPLLKSQVDVVKYGAAQEQFNISHAVEFRFPVPPLNEQDEMVEYLRAELSRLDALLQGSRSGISLLQERRSALISAAVTGKIDVRNYTPQTPKEAA